MPQIVRQNILVDGGSSPVSKSTAMGSTQMEKCNIKIRDPLETLSC